jgi:hypothetical protein
LVQIHEIGNEDTGHVGFGIHILAIGADKQVVVGLPVGLIGEGIWPLEDVGGISSQVLSVVLYFPQNEVMLLRVTDSHLAQVLFRLAAQRLGTDLLRAFSCGLDRGSAQVANGQHRERDQTQE